MSVCIYLFILYLSISELITGKNISTKINVSLKLLILSFIIFLFL